MLSGTRRNVCIWPFKDIIRCVWCDWEIKFICLYLFRNHEGHTALEIGAKFGWHTVCLELFSVCTEEQRMQVKTLFSCGRHLWFTLAQYQIVVRSYSRHPLVWTASNVVRIQCDQLSFYRAFKECLKLTKCRRIWRHMLTLIIEKYEAWVLWNLIWKNQMVFSR